MDAPRHNPSNGSASLLQKGSRAPREAKEGRSRRSRARCTPSGTFGAHQRDSSLEEVLRPDTEGAMQQGWHPRAQVSVAVGDRLRNLGSCLRVTARPSGPVRAAVLLLQRQSPGGGWSRRSPRFSVNAPPLCAPIVALARWRHSSGPAYRMRSTPKCDPSFPRGIEETGANPSTNRNRRGNLP